MRSCFNVLWIDLSATKDGKIMNARDKLHSQIQALSFLLLDSGSAANSHSKASIYTEEAITEFEKKCGAVNKDDAAFLIKEIHMLFNRCHEEDRFQQSAEMSTLYVLSEIMLIVVKVLCLAGHYELATTFVNEFKSKVRNCTDYQCTAAVVGNWVVKIHSTFKTGGDSGQALTECARALRSLASDLGDREAHSVLEGCRLVVWAVQSGRTKELSGPVLLAFFSFLEEHQERILKTLTKVSLVT